jgi:hypothetical protein
MVQAIYRSNRLKDREEILVMLNEDGTLSLEVLNITGYSKLPGTYNNLSEVDVVLSERDPAKGYKLICKRS